jgi:hypothetical protein
VLVGEIDPELTLIELSGIRDAVEAPLLPDKEPCLTPFLRPPNDDMACFVSEAGEKLQYDAVKKESM